MENVLEVLSLLWLLGVEELKELLDELMGDIGLEALDVSGVIDNELEEELIDRLEMRPTWVEDYLLFLNA